MADATYQPKIYRQQGGDRQVVASGGSLDIESGGEIDIESGGSLKLAGVAIAATAAEINAVADASALEVARTATADGTGTGTITAAGVLNFVTVTSDNADKIVILPAPVVGTIVILRNSATGYELRTSTPASIAINGGAGANAESAIAASTMVIAVCTSATTWQAISLAGTTLAAVEAAA